MTKNKWILTPIILFLLIGLVFIGAVASSPEPPDEHSLPDNLAYNPSRSGFPHPLESDRGWGGGSDKWGIVDGIRKEAAWNRGLAFTGGIAPYVEPCGWRQATINFGELTTFDRVMVWHHGLEHRPNTYRIQYWDGVSWIEAFSTNNGHDYLVYPYPAEPPAYWYQGFSTPTENRFDPVTSEKVRFELWNCDIGHGWIFEFEVYLTDDEGPIVINLTADPNPVHVGYAVNLTATIDDSLTGGSDVASAEYSLDNGQTWESMTGDFDSPTEDVYAEIGPFFEPRVIDILVRGVDAAGNIGEPASVLLAVYDPSAGFVTGGGWIWSPEGAFIHQPDLVGRVTIGFVSRYNRGQSTPQGNTQFQFRAADLNFHSTDYEWLVISGYRAHIKGSGTINGEGDYGFMLMALDGNLMPNQDYDSFRIKIWDKITEEVIYDNQMGMNDIGDHATELGGGSIVIQSGK